MNRFSIERLLRFQSLLLALFTTCSLTAYAQLSGRYSMEQNTFSPNESIEIHFEILNSGHDMEVTQITERPQQPACDGFVVKVIKVPQGASQSVVGGNTCNVNGQFFNGHRASHSIQPGKTYTVHISLNHYFKTLYPGDYWIQVKHMEHPLVETKLHFHIVASSTQ